MRPLAMVVATGARTPLGLDARSTALLLRTGLAAFGAAPLDGGDGEPITMAHDPTLDPRVVGAERAALLARAALGELVGHLPSGATRALSMRVALALPAAVGAGRAVGAASHPLAREVARAVRELVGDAPVEVEARGATGIGALLPAALGALARREVDAVLVGGVHTDYDPDVVRDLVARGRLFTPDAIDAVIPGESAAFVLLGRSDLPGRLGVRAAASIVGIASADGEVGPDATGSAFDAAALGGAFRAACRDLPDELKIGWALGDHGLEHFRIRELYAAVTRTTSLFTPPIAIDSPDQRLGRTGAAALPLFLTLAAESYRLGAAPTPIGLLFGGNDRGERTAIVVSAP